MTGPLRVLVTVLVLVVGLSTLRVEGAVARDYVSLYDDETLAHWRDRYRPGIMSNLANVLVPNLTPAELSALRGLTIDMPLRAATGGPLDFYAIGPATVVLPALSLKLFDDLSVAYAWLWKQGYSLETALEYVGLLKYGRESDYGRWPQPFEALGIPDDALDDPDVDSLAQKIFKSAVIFILLHEMGHVLHQHPGYGPEVTRQEARANEAEADAFALEVMRRLPAQPTGMFLFFQTLVYLGPNRGDFDSEAAYQRALEQSTHPLTADRMRAIAGLLRRHSSDFANEYGSREEGLAAVTFVADQVDGVADMVADPDLQRLIAQTSRRATLASLAPRRPGETLGSGDPTDRPEEAAGGFSGTYDGVITAAGVDFPVRALFTRSGDRLTGFYNFGAGVGQLDGIIEGDTAYLEWRSGPERGRARLTAAGDTLSGTWGYFDSVEDGGTWQLGPVAP